jgi:hypothetical protein
MQPHNVILFIVKDDYRNIGILIFVYHHLCIECEMLNSIHIINASYTCHIIDITVTSPLIPKHNGYYWFSYKCYKELLFRSVNIVI